MSSTDTGSEGWHNVGVVADFDEEIPEAVLVGERRIAVHPTANGFFATDAECTHEEADLCDGLLDGHEITCPKHLARFDVRTGHALSPPATMSLVTYPCEVRGNAVWVFVAPAGLP